MLVYGNMESPEEAEQRRKDFEAGIVRYHNTTWLEYDVPVELEAELSDIIEKKIAEFEKVCQCENCKTTNKLLDR
tara:strand:+ start:169 stop:393 length:225 start_codon:yes stop_codon:yes gene_type:complete